MKLNPRSRGGFRCRTASSSLRGFTLVEVMTVVAIIGLLSSLAVPNLVKARRTSRTNVCIDYMRQLDGCIQQWALESGKGSGDLLDPAALGPYIRGGVLPKCPVGLLPYDFGATIGTVPAVTCQNVGSLPDHVLP